MANLSEAYDFAMFEVRGQNAAPVIEEPAKKPEKKKAKNIIELPKEELEKNRRKKIHPFKAIVMGLCFTVIFSTVISLVYSQVQLTELTEQINRQTQLLNEEKALEVQMQMLMAEKVNAADVEEYARTELGMSKINENQVEYLNMTLEDEGTVLHASQEESWFSSLMQKVRAWFS